MPLRPGKLYGGFSLDNFQMPHEIAISNYSAQRTAARRGVSRSLPTFAGSATSAADVPQGDDTPQGDEIYSSKISS